MYYDKAGDFHLEPVRQVREPYVQMFHETEDEHDFTSYTSETILPPQPSAFQP